VTFEEEIIAALGENLDSATAALLRHDEAALRALAEQEARLMDSLRALWSQRGHQR
jgi:hypothetical protein